MELTTSLIMSKIPLYFNYIENTFPELLEKAVKSIDHDRIEVHVMRHEVPKPFTHCLNMIQKECVLRGDKCWFFMHCDAEILDNTLFDLMIKRYENPENEKIAAVCACHITDLLILYDTTVVKSIGGWDDVNFYNSYMTLDMRNRFIKNGFTQPIMYDVPCPVQMSHKESSSLRDNRKKGNLFKVYSSSYEHDLRNFFRIYHPAVDVEKNPDLIAWKKNVANNNARNK